MQIGIYKYATKSTILDISSALNYHKVNKRNEQEYKGSIAFTIHQYTKEKLIIGYLPKASAKLVLNAIGSHKFPRLFKNGFTSYGGSLSKNLARIFSIKFDSQQMKYIFQIDEGTGRLTKTGAISMVKKSKSVIAFVPYEEALKLAHETLDFINQAEMVAMMAGKPLYTIKPKYEHQQGSEQMHG